MIAQAHIDRISALAAMRPKLTMVEIRERLAADGVDVAYKTVCYHARRADRLQRQALRAANDAAIDVERDDDAARSEPPAACGAELDALAAFHPCGFIDHAVGILSTDALRGFARKFGLPPDHPIHRELRDRAPFKPGAIWPDPVDLRGVA